MACWNFFEAEDRQIPTDKIPVGGFWEMVDAIKTLMRLADITTPERYDEYQQVRALLDRYGVK